MMETILKFLLVGLGCGIAASFLWAMFWSALVPEVLSVSWSGYDDFIAPVFLVSAVGGPLAMLATYLR